MLTGHRRMFITGTAVSAEQLIAFLNGQVSGHFNKFIEANPAWKNVRQTLRACVDRIVEYKVQLRQTSGDAGEELSQELYEGIWVDLKRLLNHAKVRIQPGTESGGEAQLDKPGAFEHSMHLILCWFSVKWSFCPLELASVLVE